jgi:hypothetical protein
MVSELPPPPPQKLESILTGDDARKERVFSRLLARLKPFSIFV